MTDAALPALFADLDLELVVGSLLLFGPRRGGYVLVRQVVASRPRCSSCSSRWSRLCGPPAYGQFGDGRWSPHVTLARRVGADQVGPALAGAGRVPG